MLSVLILTVLGPLIGAITGLMAARWFLLRQVPADSQHPAEPPDPFVSAEIDRAAARWAHHQGRPEAAGVMADKLHLLYKLGRRRQRP
jgi:hypothetical protein